MNIRFYLGRTNTNGFKQLRIQVILNNDKFWIKTKHYIEPDLWNQKKQTHSHEEISNYIKAIRLKFSDIERDAALTSTKLTKNYVISRFHDRKTSQERAQGRSFIEWFDYYKERYKNKLSKGHLGKFNQVKTQVVEFNPHIDFQDITAKFYEDYIEFLTEKEYASNNISKHVKVVKSILKDADISGVQVPRDYLDFKGMDHRVDPVWLTRKEVDLLTKYSPTKQEKPIIDDFMFRLYTGIRNSDMNSLSEINFDGDIIHFTSQKSRKIQKIPLHQKAYSLAKSYDFRFPKYTLQHKNRSIKDIADKAKIHTPVQIVKFSGANRKEEIKKKCEIISTHTARRTFGRFFIEATGDMEMLREILGHTSIETTRVYVGIESTEIRNAINKIRF